MPRDEEDRIVVNRNKDISHFDKVLEHYLTEGNLRNMLLNRTKLSIDHIHWRKISYITKQKVKNYDREFL